MCGITLLLSGKPSPSDAKVFAQSCKAIRHRGPDLSGLWVSRDGVIICGHERLAIVRPDSGEQPLVTADESLVLIVNGGVRSLGVGWELTRRNLLPPADLQFSRIGQAIRHC
jgi:asparagine synthase (glutamine-hydrolysing)